MSAWLPSLRAFASPVEFLWTAFALIGLLIGVFVLRESVLAIRALLREGVNGDYRREAWRDFRTALGFVLIFLVFAEIGLGAMFSPPAVYATNRRVADLLGLSLLVAEPALVLAKIANWRDQGRALVRARRRESAH